MVRFIKHVGIFLLLTWATIAFFVGPKFDEVCIEGRLSSEQAEVVNLLHWGKCPNYRDGECTAEANDRVLVKECSNFFKILWKPSKWWSAIMRSLYG
jgi:hypothetical protein